MHFVCYCLLLLIMCRVFSTIEFDWCFIFENNMWKRKIICPRTDQRFPREQQKMWPFRFAAKNNAALNSKCRAFSDHTRLAGHFGQPPLLSFRLFFGTWKKTSLYHCKIFVDHFTFAQFICVNQIGFVCSRFSDLLLVIDYLMYWNYCCLYVNSLGHSADKAWITQCPLIAFLQPNLTVKLIFAYRLQSIR